ncbi:MAG TPA: heme-binding protein [Streptosporangiaceae bacterium]
MELAADFAFQPLDNDEGVAEATAERAAVAPDQGLGPLAGLAGSWTGPGFNAIWRPHRGASDHFLELNVTNDRIDLEVIPGNIPNRGLVQSQIFMHGLTYLQQISDANVKVNGAPAGLHIEPGLWISVPALTDPNEPAAIARLASIPHGTTILLQGITATAAGGPSFPAASLTPFTVGHPNQTVDFDEQHLNKTTPFRTSGVGLTGITQAMLDNPNSVLASKPPNVTTTTRLHVSSTAGPIVGGGTSNMSFLVGTKDGPNADAAHVAATFWLQTLHGDTEPKRLQYSQTVLLNFAGLSWPHITVATLTKA